MPERPATRQAKALPSQNKTVRISKTHFHRDKRPFLLAQAFVKMTPVGLCNLASSLTAKLVVIIELLLRPYCFYFE